jgi:hypothetical protein
METDFFCGWCRKWVGEAKEIKEIFYTLKRRNYFDLNSYRYICFECIFELTGEIWIKNKKEWLENYIGQKGEK